MGSTLDDMLDDLAKYTAYDDTDFVAKFPSFILASEERIWYAIKHPNFRKNVSGNMVASDRYLSLPTDFLAPASLAVIDSDGAYTYLLNKDVSFIRQAYPNPSTTGVPRFYAIFDADEDVTNILMAPTPASNYSTELHYFYRPASLTDAGSSGTTWLSENAYNTLLYGALTEAANYMKRNLGIDNMGDKYEAQFALGLAGLKNLGEMRDNKDVYRSGETRQERLP